MNLKNDYLEKFESEGPIPYVGESLPKKNIYNNLPEKSKFNEPSSYYSIECSLIELHLVVKYLDLILSGNIESDNFNVLNKIIISELGIGEIFNRDADNHFRVMYILLDNRTKLTYIINITKFLEQNKLKSVISISFPSVKRTDELKNILISLKKESFNKSEYHGKCINVELSNGSFLDIEIIDIPENTAKLILSDEQKMFISHFSNRIKRGKTSRYLLNGEPGTGKTETMRDIMRSSLGKSTFIIPKFENSEDLYTILSGCQIFDSPVVVMDDIDLLLGSRNNSHFTRLLGEFLSFFDGVKKNKLSLIASTNDKRLVDKAAERPGRFNLILDYSYLTPENVKIVSEQYIPSEILTDELLKIMTGTINGIKVKLTGAFISNFGDNIKEMMLDDETWSSEKTIKLFTQTYKGFYNSQVSNESRIGFETN